jgi:hypothetical protein
MINIKNPEYRPIPECALYFIDINGNIYSTNNKNKIPKIVKARIPSGKKNLVCWLFNDKNERILRNVNTIMGEVWLDKPKDKKQVIIHKDNNPFNLFVGNLFWGYYNERYLAIDGYKICRKCEKRLPVTEYGSRKQSTDGLKNYCYECRRKEYRSIDGLIKNLYLHQKQSSIRRNHHKPKYTYEELYIWVLSRHNFYILYSNWEKSGYKKDLIPSVDRINDDKGYSFDNIRLMTWEENNKLGRTRRSKKFGCFKNGKLIKIYNSLKDIKKEMNINKSNIIRSAKTNKRAYGYNWSYV